MIGMKMSLEKLKYNYAQYKLKIPNKFSCSSQNQRNSMDFQNIALIKINQIRNFVILGLKKKKNTEIMSDNFALFYDYVKQNM